MNPINTICILRLSAIGDVTHVLTVIERLRRHFPKSKITWIIGKLEYKLVCGIPGVEYIIFDKSTGLKAYLDLKKTLSNRQFDYLLHMQVAFRANLVSACINAKHRIGYDQARSKDLHGLFINQRIQACEQQHVLDCLNSFLKPLGVSESKPQWPIILSESDHAFAQSHVSKNQPALAISPCSSHQLRNWQPERYAAVADYAQQKHGFEILLCGGPGAFERDFGNQILTFTKTPIKDLIAQDTLKQSAALFSRVQGVIAPDTGPAHIANAMGTPVIGLYAASNPRRSGPYHSIEWCVDAYDQATQKFLKRAADELPWGTKVEVNGAMALIQVDQVIQQIDRLASTIN